MSLGSCKCSNPILEFEPSPVVDVCLPEIHFAHGSGAPSTILRPLRDHDRAQPSRRLGRVNSAAGLLIPIARTAEIERYQRESRRRQYQLADLCPRRDVGSPGHVHGCRPHVRSRSYASHRDHLGGQLRLGKRWWKIWEIYLGA